MFPSSVSLSILGYRAAFVEYNDSACELSKAPEEALSD